MQLSAQQKSLIVQLADGQFHSGAALARQLSLSRTAIWSLMHELAGLGLDVNAVPGKGYRLGKPLELLDAELITGGLTESARSLLPVLDLHDCIDSTSTRLGTLAREGAPSGTVCIAEAQSGGRGRIGRAWLSPFAGNICLSILWHFEEPSQLEGLSLAVGVAVARSLQSLGIRGIGLKWPNDLLWQDHKLGGVLMEVFGEAHGRHAVVIGIGLNVHIPQQAGREIDQSWTDLTAVTGGAPPPRNRLIAELLNELFPLLSTYPQTGLGAYLDEWRGLHCLEGRNVVLHQGDKAFHGEVAGVDGKGLLMLRLVSGELRAFASGDIRVRLLEG